MSVRFVKQGEGDGGFIRALIEDQTKQMMSYPEFLVHCHLLTFCLRSLIKRIHLATPS